MTRTETFEYYFKFEFQYHNSLWPPEKGFPTIGIFASPKILQKEYVDYEILVVFILNTHSLMQFETASKFVSKLRQDLKVNGSTFYSNEAVGLEINPTYCRPIDNFGSEDGIEEPLTWNIATPKHLQLIPTEEIFQLLDDWVTFLKVIEDNPPRFLK